MSDLIYLIHILLFLHLKLLHFYLGKLLNQYNLPLYNIAIAISPFILVSCYFKVNIYFMVNRVF